MRCYQHYGLTDEAEKYLKENCALEPDIVCPDCGKVISTKRKVLSFAHHEAFYSDGPILHVYKGKDGKKIKEVVQAMPWSSGPCGFLCLELEDGSRIGEWSDKEIDQNCN